MIQFLAFCFATSMAITAIHVAVVWDGMLLHFILPAAHRLPTWLQKPLYDCMTCMASIYTCLFWLLFGPPVPLTWLPFAILTTAGLNTLVCMLLDKLSDYGC